jgi:hypothetical protein
MTTSEKNIYDHGWEDCAKRGYKLSEYNDLVYPEEKDQRVYHRGYSDCAQAHDLEEMMNFGY